MDLSITSETNPNISAFRPIDADYNYFLPKERIKVSFTWLRSLCETCIFRVKLITWPIPQMRSSPTDVFVFDQHILQDKNVKDGDVAEFVFSLDEQILPGVYYLKFEEVELKQGLQSKIVDSESAEYAKLLVFNPEMKSLKKDVITSLLNYQFGEVKAKEAAMNVMLSLGNFVVESGNGQIEGIAKSVNQLLTRSYDLAKCLGPSCQFILDKSIGVVDPVLKVATEKSSNMIYSITGAKLVVAAYSASHQRMSLEEAHAKREIKTKE